MMISLSPVVGDWPAKCGGALYDSHVCFFRLKCLCQNGLLTRLLVKRKIEKAPKVVTASKTFHAAPSLCLEAFVKVENK